MYNFCKMFNSEYLCNHHLSQEMGCCKHRKLHYDLFPATIAPGLLTSIVIACLLYSIAFLDHIV